MAEMILAFGLAANVVQFIDFSSRVLSAAYGLYNKSPRVDKDKQPQELEIIAQSLQRVIKGLEESLKSEELKQTPSQNELDLRSLAKHCTEVAGELLIAIERLKTKGKLGKWNNLRTALKTLWNEDKIQAIESRLDRFRQELVFHILVSFRDQINRSITNQSLMLERVNSINEGTRGLGEKFLEYLEQSKRWQAGYIEDCRRWQADLIDVIHQDKSSAQVCEPYFGRPEAKREKQLRNKLFDLLKFTEMADRHSRIAKAYEKTFQWIFKDPSSGDKPWASFTQWLENGSSLYWITGKAGSGKSTLIKYLYHDARTFQCLETWAAGVPIATAAFFFWNSGTDMQMSQMGLLQSILHQILLRRPNLIPRILPERWEAYILFGDDHHPLSEIELCQALRLLAKEDASVCKFCFFIDGLDEFDGDHMNLIDLLKEVVNSTHIKICVSSRPLVVFEDAFKREPSLMLQDLTYPDIWHYVNSTFHSNAGFAELQKREPQYACELLKAIAQKAAGVFLWVHLVVSSLLAGLTSGDRISDLQRRLNFLPPDLENLYEKILDSLDPFYLEHASQYFQLIRVAEEPPSLLCLSFADEEPDFALLRKVQLLCQEEMLTRADLMKRRLNSRCKGLLEVAPDTACLDSSYLIGATTESLLPEMGKHQIETRKRTLAEPTVQYLHRTVKDFLENPRVWNRLLAARQREYDPYLALCRSFIAQFKAMCPSCLPRHTFRNAVRKCMHYAYLAQGGSGGSLIPLLDEFDRAASELASTPADDGLTFAQRCGYFRMEPLNQGSGCGALQPHWATTIIDRFDISGLTFLSLAVRLDLHDYVKTKLRNGCLVKQDVGVWPLLQDSVAVDLAFQKNFSTSLFPSSRMVNLLLKNEADPNQKLPNTNQTVWQSLLWSIHRRDDDIMAWLDIMSQFLAHGADPNVSEPLVSLSTQSKFRLREFYTFCQRRETNGWFGWGRSNIMNAVQMMKYWPEFKFSTKLN